MILIFWWAEDSNRKNTKKIGDLVQPFNKNGMAESSGPRGYPGQRLQDEKKVLEGQVFHKRSCGNKLLFLQLGPSPTLGSTTLNVSCPEAIFSFDVYGSEVRDVRKDISVGDVVQCIGTWRDCGTILDVFSYSIQSRWVDVSGGASFQAPEAKMKQHQPGRSSNVVKDDIATDAKDEVEAPPAPFDSTSHCQRRNLCKFWMSNGTCIMTESEWSPFVSICSREPRRFHFSDF